MNWTKKPPTEEGWYWYYCPPPYEEKPTMCFVANGGGSCLQEGDPEMEFDSRDKSEAEGYLWYGPLEVPELPGKEEL
jgi:hypothetical protein